MTLILLLFFPIIAVVDYIKRKDNTSKRGKIILVSLIALMFVFWFACVGYFFYIKKQVSEFNQGLKNGYTIYLNGNLVKYPNKLKNIDTYKIIIDHANNEIILTK